MLYTFEYIRCGVILLQRGVDGQTGKGGEGCRENEKSCKQKPCEERGINIMHSRYGVKVKEHIHVAGLDAVLAIQRRGAWWGSIIVTWRGLRAMEWEWEVMLSWTGGLGCCAWRKGSILQHCTVVALW